MKIIEINKLEDLFSEEIVACIGHFDGIHLGHKQLINKVLKLSKQYNLKSAIITMEPDPLNIITLQEVSQLTNMNTRIQLCKDLGIDIFIILKVDKEFINQSKQQFINNYLYKLNIHSLICGFDFKFAKNGEGNTNDLINSNLAEVLIEPSYKYNNIKVSTTYIKELLLEGNIELVNTLLDYNYYIEGSVTYGKQIGRTLGYPTANLKLKDNYTNMSCGVYAGYVEVNNNKYKAMINIGYNPTVNKKDNISIEAHIFNFNEDIYNCNVKYTFIYKIRNENKFNSKEELISQLHKDKETIINLLN